jgi:hypothetical protein
VTKIARLLLLAALVAPVACSDNVPQSDTTPSPTPSATETTFEETEWTIATPAGWIRVDATGSVDAKKAVRYTDAKGNYFIVAIDPSGSDFSPDTIWRYAPKGMAFEVVKKEPCTGDQCSTTDARYDGYVMWDTSADPPKVGGHTWYFIFGNTATTAVDAALFERIVESVRVKG